MKTTYILSSFVILCVFGSLCGAEKQDNKDNIIDKEKIEKNEVNVEEETQKEEERIKKQKLDEEFEQEIKNKYQAIVLEENDARRQLIRSELISAGEAKAPSDGYVSLGIIVCNVTVKGLVKGIMRLFGRLIRSLFTYSKGTSLHIIVITDKKSFSIVHSVVAHTIGKFLSETFVKLDHGLHLPKWAHLSIFPKVWVEFVDLESITEKYRETIDMMKKEYSMNKKEVTLMPLEPAEDGTARVAAISSKYSEDLFYIGPFYGYEFTQMDRMIMVDADVAVREDLAYLYEYFDQMDSDELMGITTDQAGYYIGTTQWILQREKEKNKTFIRTDDPIKQRGLNTGVVLYNLEKIRESETMREALKYDNIIQIKSDCYLKYAGFQLGDQDFFNVLMWREPQLFKTLPCAWNHQDTPVRTDKSLICTEKPKIVHKHGDIHDGD